MRSRSTHAGPVPGLSCRSFGARQRVSNSPRATGTYNCYHNMIARVYNPDTVSKFVIASVMYAELYIDDVCASTM